MSSEKSKRVLVTGGGTFLGTSIASALLAEGAEVTLLVREGNEARLGPLAQRVRWHTADIWDPASLRGRARGHGLVIHTVGSMTADPARGLTYNRLNTISARNAASMCVSDGVPRIVLLSAYPAPWVNRQYLHAKREAETTISRMGLQALVVRAPLAYLRGQPRSFVFRLMSALGAIPPLRWTFIAQAAPIPLDVLARGLARLALDDTSFAPRATRFAHARDLKRRNTRDELRGLSSRRAQETGPEENSFLMLDEDTPFAWSPTQKSPGDRR